MAPALMRRALWAHALAWNQPESVTRKNPYFGIGQTVDATYCPVSAK